MIATPASERPSIPKAPTGIHGLDDITHGGLPRGRPTLVCGGPGCGKTLLAIEFLVRGAIEYGEPAVFLAFEETAADLAANVRSLGFDLDDLVARELLVVEHIHIERSEIEEAGEFDLEGLFIRLALAIDSIGAKRVALDTVEVLFGGFDNHAILRAELRRLFRWLKDRGVTAVITAERGEGTLTRRGLEEYVSDCVILLDHRRREQVATRLLQIIKYRGSQHGTNEYPFLIGADGFSVLPLTSLVLDHGVSSERVSTGIDGLDEMLGGGPYRGSSILVSGAPGTGKSSVAAYMAHATCRAGRRCLYYSFEESPAQILRNMSSIGLELAQWCDQGLLRFVSSRPTLYGLEMHLATMHAHVHEFEPDLVVVDPISNFVAVGSASEAQAMLVRLIIFLKSRGITALLLSLTNQGEESTEQNISSMIDTWVLLREMELGGERNRGLYVLKSRGTAHSNQVREFLLTSSGVELRDVYIGPEGVLTGSMRLAQEAREREAAQARQSQIARKRREIERKRAALEAQIAALQAEAEADGRELEQLLAEEEAVNRRLSADRADMARSRGARFEEAPT